MNTWLRDRRCCLPALAVVLVLVVVSACEHGSGYAEHNDTNIVTLSKANFQEQVLGSPQPVLVDFWAVWCGPCKRLAPTVSEVAAEYLGRVKVGKVDVDKQEALVEKYKVEAFPTLLIFKDGKEVDRMVGVQEKKDLQDKLNRLVAAKPAGQ